ncbi:ATP-binding protein [Chromobacterium violaceum]|uniref:sensor histidine kinase n=1 Tax=Chromobacterium violaceum TaxID=536 RepID=UPI00385AA0C1
MTNGTVGPIGEAACLAGWRREASMLDGLRWAARPLARAGWEMGRDAGGIGPALCYAVGCCAALAALILFMRRNADSMSAFLNAAVLRPGLFRRALLLACLLMLAAGSIDLAQAPAPLLNAQADAWLWPARLARAFSGWLALPDAALLVFAGLIALFMLALWRCLRDEGLPARWWPWLAAQMLIAAALEAWTEPGLGYLVAAELAFLWPWRAAAAAALLQAALIDAALLPYLARVGDGHPACNLPGALPPPFWAMAALDWLQGLVFQAFAFCVGYGWAEARRGSRRQEAANAELQATQLLLTEAVRGAERARIADGLRLLAADQLAGLQLQLRLLRAKPGDAVDGDIDAACEAARLLGEELRAAGRPEAAVPFDLSGALTTLCRGIPSPAVRLDIVDGLILDEPALAHAVFRCVQEALSNALRHSGAARAAVRLEPARGGVAVTVSDNGRGLDAAAAERSGHGLAGMRERVEGRGGTLDILSPQAGGCCLRVWLPLVGGER